MPTDNEQVRELLLRYLTSECSEEERALVESWYIGNDHGPLGYLTAEDIEKDLDAILKKLPGQAKSRKLPGRLQIAAVFALTAAAVLWVHFQPFGNQQEAVVAGNSSDISPGGDRAVLTLGDGRTLLLDSAAEGRIASEAEITVIKMPGGELSYAPHKVRARGSSVYNMVSTPRGGQYRIVLSDGTRIWLNAASSLRYPVVFDGEERRVELTGEAYFEVAKGKPFFLESKGQVVEVLGTRFNVNAYKDEQVVKTTLLEGAVRIVADANGPTAHGHKTLTLRPGQQSMLEGGNLRAAEVDPSLAVAWKNGLFRFENSGIDEVMRQLSRWYDVEVSFAGDLPDLRLWGEVYRNVKASEALEILAYFDLKYQIVRNGDNRKIIIHR